MPRSIPVIIRRLESDLPITPEERELLKKHIEETKKWFTGLKKRLAVFGLLVVAIIFLLIGLEKL